MTDKLTGSGLVEKAFIYIASLARECRKALTMKFEHEYKGISFDSTEAIIRREVESWFTARDKNIKLSHAQSVTGKSGEISVIFLGSTKDAHFKIHADAFFTLAGSSNKASSYLKNLNLSVDKREFTK